VNLVAQLPTRVIFKALFGIHTATPLQLGLCRILDGEEVRKPEQVEAVVKAFGTMPPMGQAPRELYLLAAIRSAKSMIAAAKALRASQTVDVSGLKHGEVPRYSILSTSRDNAKVIFKHLLGTVRAESLLRPLLVSDTADTLTLRHPTGRPCEIHIAAGARAGSTLVARWSLGVTFDEAPRMGGEDDGVVNLEDSARAVRGRLLPGAQILYVGSPWAPFGPVYTAVQTHFGKPTPDVMVVRAAGPDMNPIWWTPARCDDLLRTDPDAYATDVMGEFRQAEAGLFGSELDACTRDSGDQPSKTTHYYVACIDPATRGNAWTLVVMTREGDKRIVALTKEWKGSKTEPLNPSKIFDEMAGILRPYRVKEVTSDVWSFDTLRDTADKYGIYLRQKALTSPDQADAWVSLRQNMVQGLLELPKGQIVEDLRRLIKRTTQAAFVVHLPETGDGRHCDFAPALLRAHLTYIQDAHVVKSAAELESERIRRLRLRQETPPIPVRR
jgi:hypothetical protein